MALCGSAPLVRYLAGGWARTARLAGGRTRGADEGRGPCEPSRRAAAGSEEKGGMTQDVQGRVDGHTLVVRIPMRFQRRGGRRRIVAPDGSEIAPSSKPQPDRTLIKALARAHRWQRMLESGKYGTLAELAAAERISRSYICRVLRLTPARPGHRRARHGRAADGRARTVPKAVSGRVGEAASEALLGATMKRCRWTTHN
jgi:hypothetical protein